MWGSCFPLGTRRCFRIPPGRLTPKSQHTITLITTQLITPLHTNLSPHSSSPYFSHPNHASSSHHHFITPTYPNHHITSCPTFHIQLTPFHHTTTSPRQLINITSRHATSSHQLITTLPLTLHLTSNPSQQSDIITRHLLTRHSTTHHTTYHNHFITQHSSLHHLPHLTHHITSESPHHNSQGHKTFVWQATQSLQAAARVAAAGPQPLAFVWQAP